MKSLDSQSAAGSRPSGPAGPAPLITATALGGVILSGLAAWITVTSGSGASDWAAVGRAVMVAVPVLAGCCAWYWRPKDRFGPMLAAIGFATFLTTLAESDGELLYSVGHVSGWLVDLFLVYLVLSFPSGRLSARRDRALFAATLGVMLLLYLPTALLTTDYLTPASYTSCDGAECPSNAFMVLDSEPAFVGDVIVPLRESLIFLLFAAVMVLITLRVRTATPLMRRTLAPVLSVAVGRFFVFPLALATRAVNPDSASLHGLMWVLALAVPLMAVSFVIGLLRWRLFLAGSISTMGPPGRGGSRR